MKRITVKKVLLSIGVLCATGAAAVGCNLADMTFCGFTANGPADTTICLRVNYGYGRTGASKGADGDTRSVAFGWYSSKPAFSVLAFTPPTMVSGRGFDDCIMPGSNIGPLGYPYYDQATVFYTDPGYYNQAPCFEQPFACITSAALCGNVAQQTITYTFRVTVIPDSVRVFGAEGAGNPIAGCYPNPDMMVNFAGLPVVWGAVEGMASQTAVKLKWTTLSEVNAENFLIERAVQGSSYEVLGEVAAYGYTDTPQEYEFFDYSPSIGANRYRIVQFDQDGNSAASQIIEVHFTGAPGLAWGAIGPNPTSDVVNLHFFQEQDQLMTLVMHDQTGKTVLRREIHALKGLNSLRLDLTTIQAGTYFISMLGISGKLTQKLLKI